MKQNDRSEKMTFSLIGYTESRECRGFQLYVCEFTYLNERSVDCQYSIITAFIMVLWQLIGSTINICVQFQSINT